MQHNCPLCNNPYPIMGGKTGHHIFYPKFAYDKNIKVKVCDTCHQTFNYFNNPYEIITPVECLIKWILFCKLYSKDAFEIYPQLMDCK